MAGKEKSIVGGWVVVKEVLCIAYRNRKYKIILALNIDHIFNIVQPVKFITSKSLIFI
jgi:hypothetical protein